MARTAFISGITGQDGAYLAKLLLEKGYHVHGGVRRIGVVATGRLDELGITGDVTIHDFELLEITNIQRILEKVKPDEFYNLASQSFVGTSFEIPLFTADAGAMGVLRILEAIRVSGAPIRFYQASSSEMFGRAQAFPQDETTSFYPRSPYGFAKLFGHWATVNYRESFDIHATSGILFNHESPLRGVDFVTRKTTVGMARIAAGLQDELLLGNLNAKRDWGFAGDYVEGIWRMLQQDRADDYVLASGETRTIRGFVEQVAALHGWRLDWRGEGAAEEGVDKKSGRTIVRVSPEFYRPAEVDILVGDATKARQRLDWSPKVDFQGLVEMMVRADVDRVKAGSLRF